MRPKTNVRNICKFDSLDNTTNYSFMKNLALLFSFILLINCSDDPIENECFSNISISGTINLTNPEFIDLQVPGGHAITTLQTRNVLIINSSTSGFKAFDLECPEGDCNTPMTFEGFGSPIVCCNGKEYNHLNGSPINGDGCFALEYNVNQTSSSTLQISR